MIEWARRRIQHHAGGDWRLERVENIGSRLGSVYRLSGVAGERPVAFYLKRYPSDSDWLQVEGRLAIASRITRTPVPHGLAMPSIVDASLEWRAALLSELPGQSLAHHYGTGPWRKWQASRNADALWEDVGRLLRHIHTLPVGDMSGHPGLGELRDYIIDRVLQWGALDPAQQPMLQQVTARVDALVRDLSASPLRTSICHGDPSAVNIIAGPAGLGLVDFDDVRLGMPGVDVSQAFIETQRLHTVKNLVRFRAGQRRAWRAFRRGYGPTLPARSDFWMPHIRNVVVSGLTLVRRRAEPSHQWPDLNYRWICRELRVALVQSESTPYPDH